MNKYIIIFIIIVFLVILLRNHNENFPYYYNTFDISDMYDRRYCKDCNSRSILNCGNCFNCGICIKDNISTCESGDIDGPDTKHCDKWIYNSNKVIYDYYNPYYYNPYYYNHYYYGYYDYPYYRTKKRYYNKIKHNKPNKENKPNKVVRSSKYNLDVFGRGKK